jgi:hypothetical protein
MAKYSPLRRYLKRQKHSEIVLTFSEIEDIIDAPLPRNAETPQWWANIVNPDHGHVQREAWRAAGYDAFLLPPSKVKFQRVHERAGSVEAR